MSAETCDTPQPDAAVDNKSATDAVGTPTVIEAVKGLHSGAINGKSLAVVTRRACVEYLHTEGSSVAEIARLLNVCEKTITRDRKAIQENYAVEPDPKLVPLLVGRLLHEAELAINRIRRAARDKEAEPAVRIDGEHRCYQIASDVVQVLQRIGYMPTATQRIEASLKHQIDDLPKIDDLMLELQRMRVVAQETNDDETVHKVGELLKITARANLAQNVAQLTANVNPRNPPGGEGDDAAAA